MFWKFNLISTSHIEAILNKENVTLQELMDEDDILQECKAQNKALIDFLVRPEIMEEMVNFIINEPSEDLEEKLRYKYPNTACELLTSDVPLINNTLASDENLLIKLYSFLENQKPLNPLLASFFSKTMGILITRKTETILEFLKSKDDFINSLLNHLNTSAIMDLLLRLVTCVENGKLRSEVLSWLNEQQIIQRLIALIDPASDEERHSNASHSLGDIIRFAREQMSQLQEKAEPDPLLQTLESSETISELLNHMFNGDKNESALVNGISVLLALLEFKKQGINNQVQANEQSSMYFRPESHEQMTALDAERMATGIKATLKALKPRLKEFHHLLKDPPQKNPIPTTIGLLEKPLGNTRIHVARLITCVVNTNTHDINIDLAKLGTIDMLMDLFFTFTWNNFLHTQVEQCIGSIVSNPPAENEDGEKTHPLLTQLLTETSLIQRILDAWEDNEQQQMKPGGNRRGYMGHLTKIANHIAQNAEKGPCSESIKDYIKDLSEDYRQKWETFVSNTLAEINKKNQVGGHPMQSSSEDDDADFRDIPFPQDTALQQAFSDYQMQQMTSNFIDQFGFNDDEFGDQEDNINGPLERLSTVHFNISAEENSRSADLFEQACNERIQPFDDADSDEDIWEEKAQEISFSNVPAHAKLITSSHLQPQRSNSDESSTDSEEETEVNRTNATTTNVIPTTSEEMKMEVDQNDPWTANFDAVPMDVGPVAMDTGNPWETASQPAQQQEAGWANFGEFQSFGNQSHTTAVSSPPVAMETSESSDANFKLTNNPPSEIANVESSSLVSEHQDERQSNTSSKTNFINAGDLVKTPESNSNVVSTFHENGPLPAQVAGGDIAFNKNTIEETSCKESEVIENFSSTPVTAATNGPV